MQTTSGTFREAPHEEYTNKDSSMASKIRAHSSHGYRTNTRAQQQLKSSNKFVDADPSRTHGGNKYQTNPVL